MNKIFLLLMLIGIVFLIGCENINYESCQEQCECEEYEEIEKKQHLGWNATIEREYLNTGKKEIFNECIYPNEPKGILSEVYYGEPSKENKSILVWIKDTVLNFTEIFNITYEQGKCLKAKKKCVEYEEERCGTSFSTGEEAMFFVTCLEANLTLKHCCEIAGGTYHEGKRPE